MKVSQYKLARWGSRLLNATLLLILIVGLVTPHGAIAAAPARTQAQDQASCSPQPAGLVNWWRAEGDANDWVSGNNGTLQNGATYGAGEVGQAFSFNGVDQYVSIPSSASIDTRNIFSVMAWFKVDSLAPGAHAKVFSKRVGADGHSPFELDLSTSDGTNILVSFMGSTNGDTWDISVPATQLISTGTWHHAAITVSSNMAQLSLDGKYQGGQTISAPLMASTGAPLIIGSSASGFPLNGQVDEVQFYNTVVYGAVALGMNYNAGSAGLCLSPNNAPVAVADSYSTNQNTPLSVDAPGVLANDSDVDGNPITTKQAICRPTACPAHGTVKLNTDGSFTYTPTAGYAGTDTFSYYATDSLLLSSAVLVTITVNATNQPPVAVDDSYTVDYGSPLAIIAPGLLGNDSDADGNPLTAVKVTDPANGAVTVNADGSFTYTGNPDFVGQDSFAYKASDGAAESNAAIVAITVVPPVNDSGLLGYWKFDDNSGTAAADSSGNIPANNGMLSGGAAFSASAAPVTSFADPGALSVSGGTGVVSVPNSAANKLTNNFTVMGWINPSTVSGIQRVIATARTKTGAQGWAFGLNSSWLYFTNYAKSSYLTPLSTGITAGKWHNIAATLDVSNTLTFYVDGIAVGAVANAGPLTSDPDDALLIGAETATGSSTLTYPFTGLIDDLRVYNSALSAAQIADLVGVDHCSEFILRSRVMLGEVSKTITLENGCTYTLTAAGDTSNGGSGIYIYYATSIEGNGATIQRSATAPQFRLMTTSSAITLRNLTLSGGSVAGNGGGLLAWKDVTLRNVRLVNNAANRPAGAAYVQVGGAVNALGNLAVDSSTFLNNQTDGYGGAIYFAGTTGRITNSVFANNLSGAPAAAIAASSASGSLTLLNNTFTNAYSNPAEAVLINGTGALTNNIFDNFFTEATVSGATATLSEDYNLLSSNTSAAQAVNGATITSGGHNRIAASPRFVDLTANNYRLQQNSPAIDLGANVSLATDADGKPRPATTGTPVDIGAYEYQGVGVPSISITKSGPPYAAGSGQTPFILTVINEGTASVNDLQIVDPLPAGATYVAGSASNGGTFANGKLTWNIGSLAPNQKTIVQYKVTATQDLVSSSYTVTSTSNPAVTASGPALTTPYDPNVTVFGFFPNPDGFNFANYTDSIDSDTSADDMAYIFGAASVCKTNSPSCVLNAAAEAYRQVMTTRNGGHCFGLAMSTLWLYDRADKAPSDYQPGALTTFDLSKASARKLNQLFYYTQLQTPVNTALPAYTAANGATAIVDKLKANFADPSATDRYELSFWKADWAGGHAVTPYAVKQVDADHYWIYVYDNNYPNNFDRVFKVTYSTGAWIYEGGATAPGAPVSAYTGDGSILTQIQLKSLRSVESFPKKCTSSNACGTAPATTTASVSTMNALTTNSVESYSTQAVDAPAYDFQLDGEGYLMITRSDGKRAGMDPATGEFIAEIPGAEQVLPADGDGLNKPGIIHIPHETGMTYTLSVTDRPNAYGNPSATANVNIFGAGYMTRLKGLKLDSPADPTSVQPGTNDVVGITFNGDSHSLAFTSSTLDSDTPSLGMAIAQNGKPDYTFEIGGAQMPSGKTLSVAIDTATGKLTVTNDDPASNTYTIAVERINLDGSKTTYTGTASEGSTGANFDLGSSWTGGNPIVTNHTPVAANDAYSTLANTALTVTAPGVLSNDTDADSDALTAMLVGSPVHGTVALNANGSFTYTPANNYVGADSFTYKANDGKADSNVATVTITVTYKFTGFFQPVDNLPTENTVKAGQSIPVKFSLNGNMGLNIFGPGSPSSKQVTCPGSATPVDAIETTTTSNSGLTYDSASGQYTYVWKTDKGWANTCRMFNITFSDGTSQQVLFKFSK